MLTHGNTVRIDNKKIVLIIIVHYYVRHVDFFSILWVFETVTMNICANTSKQRYTYM